MEARVFNVELTGVVGQNLKRLESDINTFLATRECVAIEQSILQEPSAGKPRLIVTVVAKRKGGD